MIGIRRKRYEITDEHMFWELGDAPVLGGWVAATAESDSVDAGAGDLAAGGWEPRARRPSPPAREQFGLRRIRLAVLAAPMAALIAVAAVALQPAHGLVRPPSRTPAAAPAVRPQRAAVIVSAPRGSSPAGHQSPTWHRARRAASRPPQHRLGAHRRDRASHPARRTPAPTGQATATAAATAAAPAARVSDRTPNPAPSRSPEPAPTRARHPAHHSSEFNFEQ